jgi:hypothetical protein
MAWRFGGDAPSCVAEYEFTEGGESRHVAATDTRAPLQRPYHESAGRKDRGRHGARDALSFVVIDWISTYEPKAEFLNPSLWQARIADSRSF